MIAALFTGSRHWTDVATIRRDIESLPAGSVVIVGDCPTGADAIVRREAGALGLRCEVWAADWVLDGKAAGPIRNSRMVHSLALHRDASFDCRAFAYLLPNSRGTRDCMAKRKRAGFAVVERREGC